MRRFMESLIANTNSSDDSSLELQSEAARSGTMCEEGVDEASDDTEDPDGVFEYPLNISQLTEGKLLRLIS